MEPSHFASTSHHIKICGGVCLLGLSSAQPMQLHLAARV